MTEGKNTLILNRCNAMISAAGDKSERCALYWGIAEKFVVCLYLVGYFLPSLMIESINWHSFIIDQSVTEFQSFGLLNRDRRKIFGHICYVDSLNNVDGTHIVLQYCFLLRNLRKFIAFVAKAKRVGNVFFAQGKNTKSSFSGH